MNITIIGSGRMGSALARRFATAGHSIVLTGRNLDEARSIAKAIGDNVHVESPEKAAANAGIIVAATPFAQQVNALRSLGNINGKIVIDISNPLTPDMSGLTVGLTTSAAEEIAKSIPGIKIVKAFNTLFAQILAERPMLNGGKPAPVFYAGDDEDAKKAVRDLIDSIGFEPVDAGPLRNARNLEPIGFQNIWFGFVAHQGTQIAPTWLHR